MKSEFSTVKRIISGAIAVSVLSGILPLSAFAQMRDEGEKPKTVTTSDGVIDVSDESWEESFPYGTFMFQNTELGITEGDDEQSIDIYRVGGTKGKVTAFVSYIPALTNISEDRLSYFTAAGGDDLSIQFENPLPITKYQAVGRDYSVKPGSIKLNQTVSTAEDAQDGDVEISPAKAVDSYYWEAKQDGEAWSIVQGIGNEPLIVASDMLETTDIRCVYTIDNETYCSKSINGEVFEEIEEYVESIPGGMEFSTETTFSELDFGDDPYGTAKFSVTFAEGEWVKTIKVKAIDNEIAQPLRSGTFRITGCDGGTMTDGAATCAVVITDDEPAEPSTIGFETETIYADKSEGYAIVKVSRTGGNQQVLTIDYETQDGSAKAGVDYASVSGTAAFFGDADVNYIEIPLIDDHKRNDNPLNFTVKLTTLKGDNQGLCTLGITETQVLITNSDTSTSDNLVTVMQDRGAIDVSGNVNSAGITSVAPVGLPKISGEPIEKGKNLEAQIVSGSDDDVELMSYEYSEKIVLPNNGDGVWREQVSLTSQGRDTRLGPGGDCTIQGNDLYERDGKWSLEGQSPKTTLLKIPDMAKMYSYIQCYLNYDISHINHAIFGPEFVYPYFGVGTDGDIKDYQDCSPWFEGGFFSGYTYHWTTGKSFYSSWEMSDKINGLKLGLKRHDAHDGSKRTAMCQIGSGYLKRRSFTKPFALKVHTPNDNDTVIDSDSANYNSIASHYSALRPKISVVNNKGGGLYNGAPFVGSTIEVKIPDNDVYGLYDGKTVTDAIFLQDENGKNAPVKIEKIDDRTYQIRLLWENMNEDDLSKQYYLNIVYERKQTIQIDVTPSLPINSDGSRGADEQSVREAWRKFFTSQTSSLEIACNSVDSASKQYNSTEFSKSNYIANTINSYNDNGKNTIATFPKLTNIQYVNFNLRYNDVILYNGNTYSGNEPIYIDVNDLKSSTIRFYYYSADSLESQSTMNTYIKSIELYYDKNANGRIDGKIDENGVFVLDTTLDEYVGTYGSESTINEMSLTPIKRSDGKYSQFFAKVYYQMTPRGLYAPTNAKTKYAQVNPAFTTTVTDPTEKSLLTEQQKGYSYIMAADSVRAGENVYTNSADNHLMYTAAASKIQTIDIPLGGDHNPAQMKDGKYTWSPNYYGNLIYDYSSPGGIYLKNSVVGKNFKLASADEPEKLNGYLGSLSADQTIVLTVQEQKHTQAEIRANKGEDSGYTIAPESASKGLVVLPDPRGNASASETEDGQDSASSSGIDSRGQGAYPELETNTTFQLPKLDLNMTCFSSIVMDGNSIGFSFGIPLDFYKSGKDYEISRSGKDAILGKTKAMGDVANFINDPSNDTAGKVDKTYESALKGKTSAGTVTSSTDLRVAFMFTYDPVVNDYKFSSAAITIKSSVAFTYQHRLAACPLVYLSITFGAGFSVSTGLNVYQKYTTDKIFTTENDKILKKGETYEFDTEYKTLQMGFKGRVNVEVLDKGEQSQYRKGALQSTDVSKINTFTICDIEGYKLEESVRVCITALEDTEISTLSIIENSQSRVYWAGIKFSPNLYMKLTAGVGIVCLHVEVYAKVTIAGAINFGLYDTKTDKYSPAKVVSFSLSAAIGIDVAYFYLTFAYDIASYGIYYDGKKDVWKYGYKLFETDHSLLSIDSDDETDTGFMRLPTNNSKTQKIHSGEDVKLQSYDPNADNKEHVPFRLSGVGQNSDAFNLLTGVSIGYTYKAVTIGSENYLVYIISRDGDNVHRLDNTQLVMSRLRLTRTGSQDSYGLVNPIDANNTQTPYIVLDDDETGDLDFSVCEDNGKIVVAWTSYEKKNTFNTKLDEDELQKAISNATNKNTVVKTASFDTATKTLSSVQTVAKNDGATVFVPKNVSDGVTVYGEAIPMTDEQYQEAVERYTRALTKSGFEPKDLSKLTDEVQMGNAQIGNYRLSIMKNYYLTYGGGSNICIATNGNVEKIKLSDGQKLSNIDVSQIGGVNYIAYTTDQEEEIDGAFVTIRRMFLRAVTPGVRDSGALLLRVLYDYDNNTDADGVYVGGKLSSSYTDPTFSNLKFLKSNLGDSLGENIDSEDFSLMGKNGEETFLLFDMCGATYIIRQSSLESITGESHNGKIIPFFAPNGGNTSTGRTESAIGVDGAGNLVAVYTSGVENSTNNAVYIAYYDPNTSSWGAGNILAMAHMDVYEDTLGSSLSPKDISNIYMGESIEGYNGAKGSADSFSFSNLQIALGQSRASEPELTGMSNGIVGNDGEVYEVDPSNSGKNTLLILTNGSFQQLKKQQFHNDATDEDEESYVRNGASKVGVYAISAGFGNAQIGEAELTFGNYSLTSGGTTSLSIGFKNTGDAPIRYSSTSDGAITVKLKTDDGYTLCQWNIYQNIIAGQEVSLSNAFIMDKTLKDGEKLYIEVAEGSYFGQDRAVVQSDALFTVESKPDLGFESYSAELKTKDENGVIPISVELTASNRGTKNAQHTWLQVSYESGRDANNNPIYTPLNLSNSNLIVGKQEPINLFSIDKSYLSEGVVYIGELDANYQRKIFGKMYTSQNAFCGVTGELNLRFELFSEADEYNMLSPGSGVHDEYDTQNNSVVVPMTHITEFTVPSNISLPLGVTYHMPISFASSSDNPQITVRELIGEEGGSAVEHLDSVVYDKDEVAITAVVPGNGIFRIEDSTTNSFVDVAFEVTGSGVGVNIFEDNKTFSFEGKDGASTGVYWEFRSEISEYYFNGTTNPMRNDLAIGKTGAKMTFATKAEEIQLSFAGTITVSGDYPNMGEKTITNDTFKSTAIKLGTNTAGTTHTVKIICGQDGGYDFAALDSMIEIYAQDSIKPEIDKTAPRLYWGMMEPGAGTLTPPSKNGEEVVYKFPLYIYDESGLQDWYVAHYLKGSTEISYTYIYETMKRKTTDDCAKGYLPLTLEVKYKYSDNKYLTSWNLYRGDTGEALIDIGSPYLKQPAAVRFKLTDNAENTSMYSYEIVDWLNKDGQGKLTSPAPQVLSCEGVSLFAQNSKKISVVCTDDIKKILEISNGTVRVSINKASLGDSKINTSFENKSIDISVDEACEVDIADSGLYEVVYRPIVDGKVDDNGKFYRTFVEIGTSYSEAPDLYITADDEDAKLLIWEADCRYVDYSLTEVTINGHSELTNKTNSSGGIFRIKYNGEYKLVATSNGPFGEQSGTAYYEAKDLSIELDEDKSEADLYTITEPTDKNNKGSVSVCTDCLVGGAYDVKKSVPSKNIYSGTYAWALVGADAVVEDDDWKYTDGSVDNLESGSYNLYVKNMVDNTSRVWLINIGEEYSDRAMISLKIEQAIGKDFLTWSAQKTESAKNPLLGCVLNNEAVDNTGRISLTTTGMYTLVVNDTAGNTWEKTVYYQNDGHMKSYAYFLDSASKAITPKTVGIDDYDEDKQYLHLYGVSNEKIVISGLGEITPGSVVIFDVEGEKYTVDAKDVSAIPGGLSIEEEARSTADITNMKINFGGLPDGYAGAESIVNAINSEITGTSNLLAVSANTIIKKKNSNPEIALAKVKCEIKPSEYVSNNGGHSLTMSIQPIVTYYNAEGEVIETDNLTGEELDRPLSMVMKVPYGAISTDSFYVYEKGEKNTLIDAMSVTYDDDSEAFVWNQKNFSNDIIVMNDTRRFIFKYINPADNMETYIQYSLSSVGEKLPMNERGTNTWSINNKVYDTVTEELLNESNGKTVQPTSVVIVPSDDEPTGTASGGGGTSGTSNTDTTKYTKPSSAQTSAVVKSFKDVSESDWFSESVAFCVHNGIFKGTEDDLFEPELEMSRYMMMTVLARLAGVDTSRDAYEQARQWAKKSGVSDGEDGEINVNRQQMLTMLYRFANVQKLNITKGDAIPSKYTDANSVEDYARTAFEWAITEGIIKGSSDTELNPNGDATRAELATIMSRFIVNYYMSQK